MPGSSPDPQYAAIDVRDVLDTLWLAAWISQSQLVTEESAQLPVRLDIKRTTPETVADAVAPALSIAASSALSNAEPSARAAGALYAPGASTHVQTDAAMRARQIRIPAGSALPNSLPIARATRAIPARLQSRVDMDLDEEATVDASAQGAGLVPVFHARLERWFEAALVVDHSPSAEMWTQTVIELERMLKLTGIFRDVRTFRLERRPELRLLNESGVARRLTALRDPTARRIVFLFSPGVSESWIDGTFGRLIRDWGASTPVALIHALPRRLWTNTALGEPVALATNPALGGPNTGLKWKRAWWARARRLNGAGVTLPVLALDPSSTQRWAEMFAARRGRSAPAFLVPVEATTYRRSREAVRPQPSLQERIDLFRTYAPDAFKLAIRLAVGPFTMPIVHLVQSSLFGRDADYSQVAEMMLSGLVRRLTPIDTLVPPDQVQFQFMRDASPLLLESLRRDDARQLAGFLQGYIEQHFGTPQDQIVLLDDPEGPTLIPAGARPFAQLSEQFVQWLHESSPRAPLSRHGTKIVNGEIVPEIAPSETLPERESVHEARTAVEGRVQRSHVVLHVHLFACRDGIADRHTRSVGRRSTIEQSIRDGAASKPGCRLHNGNAHRKRARGDELYVLRHPAHRHGAPRRRRSWIGTPSRNSEAPTRHAGDHLFGIVGREERPIGNAPSVQEHSNSRTAEMSWLGSCSKQRRQRGLAASCSITGRNSLDLNSSTGWPTISCAPRPKRPPRKSQA